MTIPVTLIHPKNPGDPVPPTLQAQVGAAYGTPSVSFILMEQAHPGNTKSVAATFNTTTKYWEACSTGLGSSGVVYLVIASALDGGDSGSATVPNCTYP